jgi:hypothetical protein
VIVSLSARSSASRFLACTKACRSSFVPVPTSGEAGADGPHVESADRGVLLIYTSDRDGFLVCDFVVLVGVVRPVSFPSTDDARLWREDHDESRKSAAPRDEEAFDDPFQANELGSL